MENKINIAELLKDCPKGTKLYSPLCGECRVIKVYNYLGFDVINGTDDVFNFSYDGRYNLMGECCIFPSKDQRDWSKFVPPCKFKTGDVLFVDCSDDEDKSYQYIFILNDPDFYGKWHSYCHLDGVGCFHSKETYLTDDEYHPRFATEEEKAKLFDAIKSHGYNWNPDTKTLERLVEPSEGTLVQIDFTRELRIADEVEVILGDYEFVLKDGKTYFVKKKPQYPKTYEECCEVLGYSGNYNMILTTDVDNKLFKALYRLKVCRDAYWKIAGEQMGLGKPWKPDWNNVSDKHCIYFISGEIWLTECQTRQCTLAFPTAEMRDAFYENFKELIEECKELL